MDRDTLLAEVNRHTWWHGIDLGHGVITPGEKGGTPEWCGREAERWGLTALDLRGKSVLDVGTWDGFFAFFAERKGAARVVAVDTHRKPTFDLAHRTLASRVEFVESGVYDLARDRMGLAPGERFDVVLFLGVFYHLKDPVRGLERVADLAGERLVLETTVARGGPARARMDLIEQGPRPLESDPTNWWNPNVPCLAELLRLAGLAIERRITTYPENPLQALLHPRRHGRCVLHAKRTGPPCIGVDAVGHDVKKTDRGTEGRRG